MSPGLGAADVLARSAEWVWVPDDAESVRTDEFWLAAYPEHFHDPTTVFCIDSARTPAELVDAVLAGVARLGREAVTFADLHDRVRPAGLEDELRRRGATRTEEAAVLARSLADGAPALAGPDDVEVRRVDDLDALRDLQRVLTAVFGGAMQDEASLAASLARVRAEPLAPRFVAYRDGVEVGAGGLTLAVSGTVGSPGPGASPDVARLWAGAVREEHRRRGVYGALLAHRLRVAAAAGCRIALVKGRLDTSAPLLRRAGFAEFGRERCWHLRLA